MKLRRRIKLGMLALGLLFLAVVGGLILFQEPERGYTVKAELSILHITPGSGVEMSGRAVGVVKRVWWDGGNGGIDIEMMPDVPLYADASVSKRAACRPDETCVILSQGTAGSPTISNGGRIQTP